MPDPTPRRSAPKAACLAIGLSLLAASAVLFLVGCPDWTVWFVKWSVFGGMVAAVLLRRTARDFVIECMVEFPVLVIFGAPAAAVAYHGWTRMLGIESGNAVPWSPDPLLLASYALGLSGALSLAWCLTTPTVRPAEGANAARGDRHNPGEARCIAVAAIVLVAVVVPGFVVGFFSSTLAPAVPLH